MLAVGAVALPLRKNISGLNEMQPDGGYGLCAGLVRDVDLHLKRPIHTHARVVHDQFCNEFSGISEIFSRAAVMGGQHAAAEGRMQKGMDSL